MDQHGRVHANGFIDLGGVPYLLHEHIDKRHFQQLDRSMIRSELFIDTNEPNRAIVDISVDDITIRNSDGSPSIKGNNTKQKKLLEMCENMREKLNHQFDVLKKGLYLRVNYQLENTKTRSVIRSMVEDLPIHNRNYFLDINPLDINDNGVVVNFSRSMVSTINEFTHGREQMILRITNVQMFYECLRRDGGIVQHESYLPPVKEVDYYNYNDRIQNHHVFGPHGLTYNGFGMEPASALLPPSWMLFNRYYHFDNKGHDIVFHDEECRDPRMKCVLIPCGQIQINRAFIINPCHKIVFKFSIWKNDLTVVNDCLPLAMAIQSPFFYPWEKLHHQHYEPRPVYPDLTDIWDHHDDYHHHSDHRYPNYDGHKDQHTHHGGHQKPNHNRPNYDDQVDTGDVFVPIPPPDGWVTDKDPNEPSNPDVPNNPNVPDYDSEIAEKWEKIFSEAKAAHDKEIKDLVDQMMTTKNETDKEIERLVAALRVSNNVNDKQSEIITQLTSTVALLKTMMETYHSGTNNPPNNPDTPKDPDPDNPDPDDPDPDDPGDDKPGGSGVIPNIPGILDPGFTQDPHSDELLKRLEEIERLLKELNDMASNLPDDSDEKAGEIHKALQDQINSLQDEVDAIKQHSTDDDIQQKLVSIVETIDEIQKKLSETSCNIMAMTPEMLDELISKIQNTEYSIINKKEDSN